MPTLSTAREIPKALVQVRRSPLASIVSDPKDAAGVARAYLECGYTQQEIADHLGVHYSTISRRVREHEAEKRRRRSA
jgi:DNA-binding MarR family transcriptional regulator